MAPSPCDDDPVISISTGRLIVELSSQGKSVEEIEQVTQIPRAALEVIIRSPLVQNEIARLQYVS